MKILVIGNLERAHALLEAAGKKERKVFHCKGDVRLTRSFSPIEPPDWILIEEKALPGNGLSLLQSLHAMDFYPARGPGTQVSGMDSGPAPATGCCLERDAQGRMRLHCGLRNVRPPAPPARARDPEQGEAAICFEYQAPLRRHGN